MLKAVIYNKLLLEKHIKIINSSPLEMFYVQEIYNWLFNSLNKRISLIVIYSMFLKYFGCSKIRSFMLKWSKYWDKEIFTIIIYGTLDFCMEIWRLSERLLILRPKEIYKLLCSNISLITQAELINLPIRINLQ